MPEVIREDIDKLNTVIKINVANNDYEERLDHMIRDFGRKVDIKGFRKGKVPKSVVAKMYGNQILADELNKIVSEELNKYLEENKIEILGQPLPMPDENLRLEATEPLDYQFMYELGLAPEIKTKAVSALKLKRWKVKLSDKDLTEEVDRLRLRFGQMTNPDDIQETDTLYVNFKEEGDGVDHDTTILLEHISDKSLLKKIVKSGKGDSFDINIQKVFSKEPEEINKHYLGLEDNMAPASTSFTMTIKNINRQAPADLDQAFFDQVYGPGAVETEEAFRERLSTEFGGYLDQQAENILSNDIRDMLLDNTKMDLPNEFLKRWIKETNGKPISDEQIEQEYDIFTKDLRWSLIFNHLAKELNLEVKPEEIEERTRESIIEQFRMYGNQNIPQEQIDEFSQQLLKDQEHIKRTYEELMNRKVFAAVKEQATIKEKETSLTEFNKETKKYQ
jgi:trigger factor